MNAAEQFANDVLEFEQRTAFLAKQPDSAENFARYHGIMKHALLAAGEDLHEPWPSPAGGLKLVPGATSRNDPPRVGFFMPTASLLAHSVNLRTFLEGIELLRDVRDKSDPLGLRAPIEPFVYTFGDPDPAFVEAYEAWPVRYCRGTTILGSWQNLRHRAISDDLDAMVFVSVAQGMAFATGMGVAPKHIWWAHKWHGLELPDLDGYIDACHPFHEGDIEIGGQLWRSTYTALPELMDASKTPAAQALRANMDVGIVFGWMGRSEKLTAEYIGAVIEILRAMPDSIYVYTGRQEPEWVAGAFARAGLIDRTAFLGWIDTQLWAQVIDIYLDTFPFQSGHCAYQAMAAGKPVVWLHDAKTAEEQSASALIEATWEKGASEIFPLRPYVSTAEDYVSVACQYAAAPTDTRLEAGVMWRQWLQRFMMDKHRMAASVSAAILDVIDG